MPKFTIKDRLAENEDRPIELEVVIDEQGDFDVKANGINLFYLAYNGILNRYYVDREDQKKLSGLQFEEEGRIKTDR